MVVEALLSPKSKLIITLKKGAICLSILRIYIKINNKELSILQYVLGTLVN